MQVYDYIQNGNNQMFLLSVFSARYLDIFCTYMLLTFAVTFFLNLDFLYNYLAVLLIHFLHYRQNINLSQRYVLSKNVSANNSDNPPSKAIRIVVALIYSRGGSFLNSCVCQISIKASL